MPAGTIHEDDGMRSRTNVPADLIEVQLHGFGVGPWQHESRSDAPLWADGTEQIGALIALIGRLAGACSRLGPHPGLPVLLPDPGLVLEPDLDSLLLSYIG